MRARHFRSFQFSKLRRSSNCLTAKSSQKVIWKFDVLAKFCFSLFLSRVSLFNHERVTWSTWIFIWFMTTFLPWSEKRDYKWPEQQRSANFDKNFQVWESPKFEKQMKLACHRYWVGHWQMVFRYQNPILILCHSGFQIRINYSPGFDGSGATGAELAAQGCLE